MLAQFTLKSSKASEASTVDTEAKDVTAKRTLLDAEPGETYTIKEINTEDEERAFARGLYLHELDKGMPLRFSHENTDVAKLYEDFLGEPLSEKSEELLHVKHSLDFKF